MGFTDKLKAVALAIRYAHLEPNKEEQNRREVAAINRELHLGHGPARERTLVDIAGDYIAGRIDGFEYDAQWGERAATLTEEQFAREMAASPELKVEGRPEADRDPRSVAEIRADYNEGRIPYDQLLREEEEREGAVGTQAYWDEIEAAPPLYLTAGDADRIDTDRERAEEEELYREPRWDDLGEQAREEYMGDRAAEMAEGETSAHFAAQRMEADGVPASAGREVVRTAAFWKDSGATAEAEAYPWHAEGDPWGLEAGE